MRKDYLIHNVAKVRDFLSNLHNNPSSYEGEGLEFCSQFSDGLGAHYLGHYRNTTVGFFQCTGDTMVPIIGSDVGTIENSRNGLSDLIGCKLKESK